MSQAPVVVIGAGAAGLATAAALREGGRDVKVLERAARVGASWAGRYDSLHLHTVRWLSGLPGVRIPRYCGKWVARDVRPQALARARAAHHRHPHRPRRQRRLGGAHRPR